MELINREDVTYEKAYNGRTFVDVVKKSVVDQLPVYDAVEKQQIMEVIRVLNQRALEAYKKSVKSRQTYDIVGDPAEKDRALRYEGYADGLTKAVHYLEDTFGVKLDEKVE